MNRIARNALSTLAVAAVLAGCKMPSPSGGNDFAPWDLYTTQVDIFSPVDLAVPPRDLAGADLSGRSDLAAPVDMSRPMDISIPMDLARPKDMASAPDLATGACAANTDCRLYSNLCETSPCQCMALSATAPDPPCSGDFVMCPTDPCFGYVAVCVSGQCMVR
jgi:hypothetical protein